MREDMSSRKERLHLLDAIRGFSVISMVAFHYCYDLKFIMGADLAWFAPPCQDVWRASISWAFIALSGFMCCISRNNLRRGARYSVAALAIFAVTSLVAVDAPISFGVIFCMAGCTLLEGILELCGVRLRSPLAALVLFVLFVLCLGIPRGTWGIGALSFPLPRALYDCGWLAWAGFPGPGFVSGDYYPLLPYALLYLAGTSLGGLCREREFPEFLYRRISPLELVGRHALPIYLAHQPLLLLLCGAIP